MSVYKGDPNNKESLFEWLEKCENLAKKRKESKNKLIESVIEDLKDNIFDSSDYIFDLCREALIKRTQKELKEILNGNN